MSSRLVLRRRVRSSLSRVRIVKSSTLSSRSRTLWFSSRRQLFRSRRLYSRVRKMLTRRFGVTFMRFCRKVRPLAKVGSLSSLLVVRRVRLIAEIEKWNGGIVTHNNHIFS